MYTFFILNISFTGFIACDFGDDIENEDYIDIKNDGKINCIFIALIRYL